MLGKMVGGCLVVLLGAMFLAGQANALEIWELDGAGGKTLVSTGPWTKSSTGSGETTVTDISGGAGTDWEVMVGVPNFGSAEGDVQTSAIYGAGVVLPSAFGYEIVFDFDGYTWDSYNTTVPVNQGAKDGYWDLFAVNINQDAFYWDLVDTGAGGYADSLLSTDPAGTPVYDPDGTGPLPGATWGWGGLDYAAGYFEEEHGTYTISLLDGGLSGPYFLSAVLDTATIPQADMDYPSWGGFNANGPITPPDGGQSQDVPEPSTLLLLGAGLLALGLFNRKRFEV